MNPILRAAGFAAVSLLTIIGTAYAAPAQNWSEIPTTSSFLDHESASLSLAGGDLGLNPVETAPVSPTIVEAPVPAEIPAEVEPQVQAKRPLAELVGDYSTAQTEGAEHECLAGAVYFESKGEPLQGQLSVAQVVMNRSSSGRFPSSICGVVKQRGQFSFVRGGRIPPIARNSTAWHRAVAIARIAMADLAESPTPRALFFHARRVSPGWRGLTRLATVGNHVFYR
ncbi:MAG: cell wall hydrolase [Allosphingosinicella sp.]